MKIGILTFHRAFNCGAMLQAWALQVFLERRGHVVEFPDVNRVGWSDGHVAFQTRRRGLAKVGTYLLWLRRRIMSLGMAMPWREGFERFMRQHLRVASGSLGNLTSRYDCVIVGSDQVWNPIIAKDQLPIFLCQDIAAGCRKIAYAVSVGDDPHCVEGQRQLFEALVPRFAAVSVREKAAQVAIQPFYPVPLVEVVDPTLLLEASDYAPVEDDSLVPHEPYLFAYFVLGPTKRFAEYARNLGRRLGLKVIIACNYRESRVGDPPGMTYGVTPGTLLGLVKHAKFVVAASFHGTVFALHYQRPFVILRETVDAVESRPASLVRRVGLSHRVVTLHDAYADALQKMLAPLPVDLRQRIADLRRESVEWIVTNLKETAG